MPGQWIGSARRDDLPANWASEVVPFILDRDGHRCTWITGHPDGDPAAYLATLYDPRHQLRYDPDTRCVETSELEVDHAGERTDHRAEALRTLCHWHHAKRSSAQGNAARRRPSNRRKPEEHPGLRAARRLTDRPPF